MNEISMKLIWRFSLFSHPSSSSLKTLTPFCFTLFRSPVHPPFYHNLSSERNWNRNHHPRVPLFNHRGSPSPAPGKDVLIRRVSELKTQLLSYCNDSDKVATILDGFLFEEDAFLELLRQLRPWPLFSQLVFDWRRNKALCGGMPMTPDEYSKGITLFGRLKKVDMAVLLFNESAKTTSVYNALMGAYMWNGLADQCNKLFLYFKAQGDCMPSVAPYNILISVYGRLIMVDRMEAVFHQLKQLKFSPDSSTYNNLIAGYIYAWNWDKMVATFELMKYGLVKPTLATYLLMLRGYANSGNLVRMEEIYRAVKHHVDRREIKLIESMICAYYRSSDKDRIRKIKTLSKLVPKESYKPWFYVLLIQIYGQEDNLQAMENVIDQAITKGLHIETDGILKSIVANYFRCNEVDKLAKFVQRAHSAGWRMNRSMFHGLMIMYGSQKRFEEMENVLSEMESFNISRSKKTHCILHRVYSTHGQEYKVSQVAGMMVKHGHGFPRPFDV
ncbi:hypothetical protein AALP_AA4G271600 [Arabis alpina]|uniref:Pentacotripeptide-repeat region of PRORP domain-containing protein n=1 Tax=Arabis alpina TaxID=50452 RepID=A0A087H601_ARAAL|nr:hypothetical protein AALP_AA4G271600 [Arabis alpina]